MTIVLERIRSTPHQKGNGKYRDLKEEGRKEEREEGRKKPGMITYFLGSLLNIKL